MVPILVLMLIIAFLSFDYVLQRRAMPAGAAGEGAVLLGGETRRVGEPPVVGPDRDVPGGVFLAPGHTWLAIELDGSVKLGPGRLPLWLLGGGRYTLTLAPGTRVHAGDTLALLTQGDRELPLRSAIDATVLEVNESLLATPERQNRVPLAQAWLYRLQPDDLGRDLVGLRVGAAAKLWLQGELRRARDLLMELQRQPGAAATMADGGLPHRGLATRLDPQTWQRLSEALFFPEELRRAR